MVRLILILLLTSCSAQYHLKKAIEKDPSIVQTKRDTIKTIIPEVKIDTVVSSPERDTVVIEKERLKIKYVNLAGDSVYIEGECKEDTVYVPVTHTVYVEKESFSYRKFIKKTFGVSDLVFYLFHVGVFLLIIAAIFKRVTG